MPTAASRALRLSLIALLSLLAACKGNEADLSKGGTELDFSLAGASGEQAMLGARAKAVARLSRLKIPARVQVNGERLRVQIPKSVDAASIERAKKALAIRGLFEIREVDEGGSLRAIGSSLPEGSGARIVQDTWTDHRGLNQGAFTVVADTEELARKALTSVSFKPTEGTELLRERPFEGSQVRLYSLRAAALGNDSLKSVRTPYDAYLPPEASLTFTEAGSKAYQELTSKALGRKIAFVVDGEVLETAAVLAPVSLGKASITQPWTGSREERQRQAEVLAAALESGPMPGTPKLEEERPIASAR